eukprot:scaffold51772_cov111-Attheya_sp.AAC.1
MVRYVVTLSIVRPSVRSVPPSAPLRYVHVPRYGKDDRRTDDRRWSGELYVAYCSPEPGGWRVPIKPETGHMVDSWHTPLSQQGFEEHSRTMLPLTTVWAFTILKGQTFTGK